MNLALRYVALALVSLVSLHYLASYSSTSYQQRLDSITPSWSKDASHLHGTSSVPSITEEVVPKANATFFVLCREKDLNGILSSVYFLETTFNGRPNNQYPYVFLNEVPFSDAFKLRIQRAVSSSVEFGVIPPEVWDIPEHINMTRAQRAWEKARKGGMPYGGSQSYRQMCRFQSGHFFRHPLLQQYRYYWRVEPDVKFLCDLEDFDPFRFMQQKQKKYGFVIALHEIPGTVTTLWIKVRAWYEKYPQYLHPNNLWKFVTDNDGKGFNKCHFWSNFEIADMDAVYRTEGYLSFFEHLDQQGGFFYERWGDAPVHSIGAALMLDKNDIHFFDNIGYYHPPLMHCPKTAPGKALLPNGRAKCYCAHESSFDFDDGRSSCLYQYLELHGINSTKASIDFYKPDTLDSSF